MEVPEAAQHGESFLVLEIGSDVIFEREEREKNAM